MNIYSNAFLRTKPTFGQQDKTKHNRLNNLAKKGAPVAIAVATACNPTAKITDNYQDINSDKNRIEIERQTPYINVESLKAIPKKLPEPRQYDVLIDAGHDSINVVKGCNWKGEKVMENLITRDIAEKVEANLGDKGYCVKILLNEDEVADPQQRQELKDLYNPKSFVSLHANWWRTSKVRGVETFYNSEESKDMAQCIYDSYKRSGYKMRFNKKTDFTVLKDASESDSIPKEDSVKVPSSLVEIGYMSNYYDARGFMTEKGKEKHAKVIANGITDYLENYLKIEPQFEPNKPKLK